ncbi:MAG: hypothetical protein MUP58_03145 [Candidatus Nanohaloarchaeota archaeon QJJ-9]|nr:hypothetical protein [Candidatus Nanohaloarchaeota archaeon QJJ-9]
MTDFSEMEKAKYSNGSSRSKKDVEKLYIEYIYGNPYHAFRSRKRAENFVDDRPGREIKKAVILDE